MKWAFWLGAFIVLYTQFGYLGWLWLRARLRPKPVRRAACLPRVSVVMVVRNEERVLPRKLENLSRLDYPADKIEFIVVSDGSTDSTENILRKQAESDRRFRMIIGGESRGKASGLNDAIRAAAGEIVLFTDARQEIEPQAVRYLAENFADPAVGCASGELMLGELSQGESKKGTGLYWKLEKKIRQLESDSGSVVGATGALYAARRALLVGLPSETILDDVYLPMHVVRSGSRVVFDERARAWDAPNLGDKREFSRKVRTLSGNYQLLRLAPWLLGNGNPIRFEFVSHKLMRLIVPLALAMIFVASLFLAGPFFRMVLVLQIVFYALSVLGMLQVMKGGDVARAADAARTFVLLNVAATVALVNWITRRKVAWASADREMPLQAGELQ